MFIPLIREYQRKVSRIKGYGERNEGQRRRHFANLLEAYCSRKNLILLEELSMKSRFRNIIYLDGTAKGLNRMDWGYWEAKPPKLPT